MRNLPDLYNQRIKLMRSAISLDGGNAQEALREFPRALLEEPDPVDRQESLEVCGHALCESGQAARRLAALREAMLLNEQTNDDENAPWTARLRARIGRCAFGQGDHRSAAALAAQARAAFRAQPEVSPCCKAPLTSLERQLGLKLPPI
jgi:tetratricopeptide (TPR) repeat protein